MEKILILANNDVGLYKFRKEFIQELIDQGNKIFISLPNGPFVQPLIDMGCTFIETKVDRRGINPFTDLKLVMHYIKLLMSLKPNKVITYTVKPNVYGGIASRIMRIPYIVNITGVGTAFQKDGFLKKIIVRLYKIACKKAKVVFFENEENKKIFIDNNIVKDEIACKLNGAGVNLDEFQFKEYPVSEKIHFLFIGRVMKEKGVDELFEAVKRIKSKYNNVIFDIVGPFEDDYSNLIDKLEQDGAIEYHGFQEDVRPFIEKSGCLILPSYHEGMANTLLEAGAMGRPLITTNISGCKEAVIDEQSGFLVKVSDPLDLYEKILRFIELDFNEKKDMGKFSYQHISNTFDKKIVVDTVVKRIFEKGNKCIM
ncbi:glycosyltransferase family 1 protein [Bacillus thuringiensis]|uniref:glycosyltransferase family 4 protein n=1 Tax=Bacillus thuringiensis TaxID=1428 RepID=UPI000BF4AF93|nr:glycosyltransferase family 4 protein [Bacillus thuringiensis]PFD93366.1 glycosyltransferase family 1 protein [Bacillus thuringiensis]